MIKYIWAKFFKKIRGSAIKSSSIHKTSKVEAGSQFINSEMGKHSFCGYDCDISNTEIGSFCSIANNVIIGGGMHPVGWVGTSPAFYEGRDSIKAKFSNHKRKNVKKTIIQHDVWIGQSVIIKQGVTIGTGAVIGMGSIVTKDVPPYSIYAGNPAKFIKQRFDSNISEQLLKIEWWNFHEQKLLQLTKYFKDPDRFIREANKII
jgi:acetyltransferase-like isoleucine patch superfamily enzyme